MVKISGATQANQFTLPDEDIYVFRLTEVGQPETKANPFYRPEGEHQNKPWMAEQTQVRFIWTIEDPSSDFHGETVYQFYNLSLGTPDYPSKLRPFVAALSGAPVDDEAEYELDDFVDRKIRATLVHKKKESGGMKAVIESPMTIRRKANAATVSAPQRQPQTIEDIPFDAEEVPYD